MTEFVLIVLAIVVAQFITAALGMAILLNRKVLKAYTKYAMKIGEEVSEEIMDSMLD